MSLPISAAVASPNLDSTEARRTALVMAAISSSSFSAASEILGPSEGAFFSFVRPVVFSENLSVLFLRTTRTPVEYFLSLAGLITTPSEMLSGRAGSLKMAGMVVTKVLGYFNASARVPRKSGSA
eukprot:Mycagemm_TRINITY_DN8166_c0_g1::TRINITY_DN8166_c0_g1_i1::g.38::m.38 type:complete len:125 gc:universal TRINITY_DN8166_c0_g1_i1:179-553(+)